jgi:hypothetical protein
MLYILVVTVVGSVNAEAVLHYCLAGKLSTSMRQISAGIMGAA